MRRIEYPKLPEGSVHPAVKKALCDVVDQCNAVIAEAEKMMKEGAGSGGKNG